MKKIRLIMAGLMLVPALALGYSAVNSESVLAQTGGVREGVNAARGNDTPEAIDGDDGIVKTAVNIMLWIIGVIAVIMLVFGGIRYATSAGDSNKVTAAKNTIMYAIVGLVIAIFAYAIVNWVLTSTTGS